MLRIGCTIFGGTSVLFNISIQITLAQRLKAVYSEDFKPLKDNVLFSDRSKEVLLLFVTFNYYW